MLHYCAGMTNGQTSVALLLGDSGNEIDIASGLQSYIKKHDYLAVTQIAPTLIGSTTLEATCQGCIALTAQLLASFVDRPSDHGPSNTGAQLYSSQQTLSRTNPWSPSAPMIENLVY